MLTIQYLYYNQPQAIEFFEQLGYPNSPVHFLFIDDGSKEPLQVNWKNATVLRINEDTPWNQPVANNIGFTWLYKQGKEVVLRMDIDHYFTISQLQTLSLEYQEVQPKTIHHFKREAAKPHPNIYMARVKDLLEAGGYSREFCGNYGYDDKEFMHRLHRLGFKDHIVNLKTQVNHSLRTPDLNRDQTINYKKYQELVK